MNTKCQRHGNEHPEFMCPDKEQPMQEQVEPIIGFGLKQYLNILRVRSLALADQNNEALRRLGAQSWADPPDPNQPSVEWMDGYKQGRTDDAAKARRAALTALPPGLVLEPLSAEQQLAACKWVYASNNYPLIALAQLAKDRETLEATTAWKAGRNTGERVTHAAYEPLVAALKRWNDCDGVELDEQLSAAFIAFRQQAALQPEGDGDGS